MWSLQKFSDARRRTLEKHPRLHPRSDSLSQTSQQIRGKCLNSGWCQWIWSWRLPVVCCSTKNLLNFIQMLFDVDVWKCDSCQAGLSRATSTSFTRKLNEQTTPTANRFKHLTCTVHLNDRGGKPWIYSSALHQRRLSSKAVREKTPHRRFVGKVDCFGGNSDVAAQLSAHYARVVQVPDCGLCAHRFGFVPVVDEKLPSTGSGVLSGSEHAIVQNHIWIIC